MLIIAFIMIPIMDRFGINLYPLHKVRIILHHTPYSKELQKSRIEYCWQKWMLRSIADKTTRFFPTAHYHMSRRQTYCLDLRDVLFFSFDILLQFCVFTFVFVSWFFFNILCMTFQMQYHGRTIWIWKNILIFAISWPAQHMWHCTKSTKIFSFCESSEHRLYWTIS